MGWAGDPRNPFNQPYRGFFIPPGLRRPTQPDPWVREEFEVETGRVVSQETIEGDPPDTESRALPSVLKKKLIASPSVVRH